MAIEIRQLLIRAVVEPRRGQSAAPASPPDVTTRLGLPEAPAPPAISLPDREELVAECTRQVLRELRKGRER